MNTWLTIVFSLILTPFLHSAPVSNALDALREDTYGFVLCDMGISPEDLTHFSSIDIQREWIYHQFGELEKIEESVVDFIGEIGSN